MPSHRPPRKPRRVLVTGTAGTGRRAIGAVLALERGFRHLDDRIATTEGRGELLRALVQRRDLVVTWTGPLAALPPEWLRSFDFEVVWLDGDRGASQPPGTRFVDPFAANGGYRPLDQILDEILSPVADRGRTHAGTRERTRA